MIFFPSIFPKEKRSEEIRSLVRIYGVPKLDYGVANVDSFIILTKPF